MNRHTILALLLPIGLNVGLAFGLAQERLKTAALVGDLTDTRSELNRTKAELHGFQRVVYRTSFDQQLFLEGTYVGSSDSLSWAAARNGVFYVIDVECAVCAANVPFLNALAVSDMVPVTGLSYDSRVALQDYIATHSIAFPIVNNIAGRLPSLIPANLTPVTILVQDATVQFVHLGVLPEEVEKQLRHETTRWAHQR